MGIDPMPITVILVQHSSFYSLLLLPVIANLQDEMEASFAVTCGHPAWTMQHVCMT